MGLPNIGSLIRVLVLGTIVAIWLFWIWRARLLRSQFVAKVKIMAKGGQSKIDGHPVEHWLEIVNHQTTRPIVVRESVVLTFKGREFFFADGGIGFMAQGKGGPYYRLAPAFLLVAVGQPAVELLSNEAHVFRLITGTNELAVFSIFRWADFAKMLMAEKT
jgi:hypothetical protein